LKLSPINPQELSFGVDGVTFTGSGGSLRAEAEPSRDFGQALQEAGALTIEVWVRTDNATQEGPRRMVAYSRDHSRHSLVMGQQFGQFGVRCQSSVTDDVGAWLDYAGCPGGNHHLLQRTAAFPSVAFSHLALVFNPEWPGSAIYVNGVERQRCMHRTYSGELGVLSGWTEDSQILALGDSPIGGRSWQGTLKRVLVWTRALPVEELLHHYENEADLDSF
jgi:hypothetical protein